MGKSVSEFHCEKHFHLRELQGVCPSCLREKLSHLCFTSSNREISRVAPSCSSSASYSPVSYSCSLGYSESLGSPDRRDRHRRNASDVVGSILLGVGSFSLRKSRSIAFAAQGSFGGEARKEKEKKKGFWTKLLGLKGKKQVLMHSSSVRERFRGNLGFWK